jgi:hypothetical protein
METSARGWGSILLVVACLLASASAASARDGSEIPTRFRQAIDVAPRRQWDENFG